MFVKQKTRTVSPSFKVPLHLFWSSFPSLEEQPQLVLSGPDRHLLTPGTRAPPVAHKNIATGIPASIPAAEKLFSLPRSHHLQILAEVQEALFSQGPHHAHMPLLTAV